MELKGKRSRLGNQRNYLYLDSIGASNVSVVIKEESSTRGKRIELPSSHKVAYPWFPGSY